MDKRPIGIFDSGVGGLTVLSEVIKLFPLENFVYVADEKNCPYGTKTKEEVSSIVKRMIKYLISLDVKAIIIACNTASLYLEDAKEVAKDIPVISVIEPTAKYASELSKNKKIIVLATNMTIQNGKYQKLLSDNGITPFGIKASELVDFIEHHKRSESLGDEIVCSKLKDYVCEHCDTLIFGCTHFSLVKRQIKRLLGNINYVSCGYPTALDLRDILVQKNLLNGEGHSEITLYTTGSTKETVEHMKWFKVKHKRIKHLEI